MANDCLGDARVYFRVNDPTDGLLWTYVSAFEAGGNSRSTAIKKLMLLGFLALENADISRVAPQLIRDVKLPTFEEMAGYPMHGGLSANESQPIAARPSVPNRAYSAPVPSRTPAAEPASGQASNSEELLPANAAAAQLMNLGL